MRKLTKTLTVISLLAPVEGYSLGIGDIKLHSALNQNLNAEIALVLGSNESIEDIHVRMAKPEKFDEAGVPWTYSLSKIKFQPRLNANGSAVVQLRSDETIQEPFLSFLVEISWPKGSLYREFTVLVDPPSTYLQPVIPVSDVATVQGSRASAPQEVTTYSSAPYTESQVSSGAYGPVKKNDTLWEIADRVNSGRRSSIEQMMMALYEANPQAFYQKNVNTLSAGSTLRIPDNEVVFRLSRTQAKSAFLRQTNEWKNRFAADQTGTAQAVAATETATSQLKLVAPDESKIDEQTIVTASEIEKAVAGDDINQVGLASSEVAQENVQLKSRMEELEQKLAAMEMALEFKDQQLAALQAVQMDKTATKTVVVQPDKTKAVKSGPVKTVDKQVSKVKPKPAPQPVSDDSGYYSGVGGIGAVVIGLLAWLWWRKRKAEEEISQESMFSSSFATATGVGGTTSIGSDSFGQAGVSDATDAMSLEAGSIGESSILSEFTPSDFDAFETDQSEVDPISEADVYLAYGRYQQAEELMRQAIEEQPDRDECKLKLLEILYANENAEAFEAYANQLNAAGKQQDSEFWARVVEMGSEICPDLAVFSGADSESGFDREQQTGAGNISDVDNTEGSTAVFGQNDKDSAGDLRTEQEGDSEALKSENPTDSPADEFESFDFEMPDATKNEEGIPDSFEFGGDDTATEETIESFEFSGDSLSNDNDIDLSGGNTEDDQEFDFDMDTDFSALGSDGDEAGSEQVENLTDMDEFQTKIDLAKAYVDMGDEDAAKTIAEEVLVKGSQTQKQVAQELLDKLA